MRKEHFEAFYHNEVYTLVTFPNSQQLDEAEFIGRVFSASYVPAMETKAGQNFLAKIKALFERHEHQGMLKFRYRTEIYLGQL